MDENKQPQYRSAYSYKVNSTSVRVFYFKLVLGSWSREPGCVELEAGELGAGELRAQELGAGELEAREL